MAAGNAPRPEAGGSADAAPVADSFVINLCSSTTPMALAHPESPELKRFSFFVSRRREDNRERFRLHMGYFTTLAEAEEWLSAIRDLYPGAWAGEAPGKKLRARAAAAAAADQLPSPPGSAGVPYAASTSSTGLNRIPQITVAPAAAAPSARAAAPTPAHINVPTLQAAPPPPVAVQAAPVVAPVHVQAPAPSHAPSAAPRIAAANIMSPVLAGVPAPRMPQQSAPAPVQQRVAAKAAAPVPTAQAPAPRAPMQPQRPAAAAASVPQQQAKPAANRPHALNGSNVREVMASLDETTGETRQMQVPPGLRSPAARPPARPSAPPSANMNGRVQTPAINPPVKPNPRVQVATTPTPAASSLSDTGILRILEQRRPPDAVGDEASAGISLLKPDDTQTRLALKAAIQDNVAVAFAVQLHWSVQPVELDKVPPLAIFSAYTLYTVEGSREGRKWYGLRLGFFSDAISAKQVAYYVRSEFASVAVVPVSPQEKSRASDAETKAATGSFQKKKVLEPKVDEFKLFEEAHSIVSEPPPPPKAAPAAKAPARGAPLKKNKPLGRVRAKDQRSAKTLEETLEILGASELEMDNGRGEIINDTGVRHLRVEVQKNTPFAKLLDRLSERVRKN